MRTGMLRPMKSNDMIRLSLGRLIVTNRGSAPNRAIVPRRVRRLRYATSTAIANPAVTNSSAINQRRWLRHFRPRSVRRAAYRRSSRVRKRWRCVASDLRHSPV